MSRVQETAFLPAALEVQATGPSPAGRGVLWVILAFFTLGILWASLGKVEIVAAARGRVVPVGHSKAVQAADGGSVTRLHVSEGQRVRKGDLLVELDARVQQADLERLVADQAINQRAAARLEQLLAWLAEPSGGTG